MATPIFAGNTVIFSQNRISFPVGSNALGPFTLPLGLRELTIATDISTHGAGSTTAFFLTAQLSLDGGATFEQAFGFGRDKGYAPISKDGVPPGWSFMTFPLPPSAIPLQIQGTLVISNAPLITAVQVEGQ